MTKPPHGMGCLVMITSILSIFQIIFAFQVLQQSHLIEVQAFPAEIQAGIAVLWSCAFFLITIALVRGKFYAVRYGGWLTIAFVAYNLLRYVIFAQADYDRGRLSFIVILTLGIITIPIILLAKAQGDQN